MTRSLSTIARDIVSNWANPHFAARPYIKAMLTLQDLDDLYGVEDAESIVMYFLTNAETWRGPVARDIKGELRRMLGKRPKKASAKWVAGAYFMKLRSQE